MPILYKNDVLYALFIVNFYIINKNFIENILNYQKCIFFVRPCYSIINSCFYLLSRIE